MSTTTIATLGVPVPVEYDNYLQFDPSSIFDEWISMTADPDGDQADFYAEPMAGIQYYSSEPPAVDQATRTPSSPLRASASSTMDRAAASDLLRSPATPAAGGSRIRQIEYSASSGQRVIWRGPGVESVGGSSVSPVETILTPTSTQFDNTSIREDSQEDFEGEDDDLVYPDISPTSTTNTGDSSFEFVSRNVSSTGSNSAAISMNNQPPHSAAGSGASRASSLAPQSSSTSTNFSGVRWGSVTTTTTGWMDAQGGYHAHSDPFSNMSGSYAAFPDNTYATADQFSTTLWSDAGPFDPVAATSFHWRSEDEDNFMEHSSRIDPPYQQSYPQQQHQLQAPYLTPEQQARLRYLQSASNIQPTRINTSLPQQQQSVRTAPPVILQPGITALTTLPVPHTARRSVPNDGSSRLATAQQRSRPSTAQQIREAQRTATPSQSSSQSSSTSRPSNKPYQPIVKAEPGVGPSNTLRQASQTGHKGGRQPNTHLSAQARQKSNKMRKIAACWRCALQRDPCDEGTPCARCQMRSQKGQNYYFDCDRSKLPDFVQDFLPRSATMTLMHQKQTIEDTVNDQVLEWDSQNPIDVYLTSGYGPALRWKLYEFRPRSGELLGQLQYFQDARTGISQGYQKYSPPFGLMKLDQSDDTYFEGYLDQLMNEDYLPDLGWTCFEEETQVDPEAFQANLLDFMCSLYKDTDDDDLKQLLRAIIRMMIITYIMGHTLTIVEETLPSVLTNIKFSVRPTQSMRQISPRLANRQLKFFFAILRNNIYSEILRWQQQTLHTSGKKEGTWLTSFCAMLGFAMVLEEVQRTLQIQADAKVAKKELPADVANAEACNACERIDKRFKLLVGLFQCKYRDKKWGERGSFGQGTPQLRGLAENRFLGSLRMLLEEKYQHLENRQHIQCSPENQCRYTSRLVARFLLPFLQLPP